MSELSAIERNPYLTVQERQVFNMFYIDGREIEWIAAEIFVSRSTVSRILRNIRDKHFEWQKLIGLIKDEELTELGRS